MYKNLNLAGFFGFCALIAGCNTVTIPDENRKSLEGEKRIQEAKDNQSINAALGSKNATKASFDAKNSAFITSAKTGASQRVIEDKALPPSFSLPITFRFGPNPVPVARVFRELETELQMPVRLSPDVFSMTSGSSSTTGAQTGTQVQPGVNASQGAVNQNPSNMLQQQRLQFQGVQLLPDVEVNVSGTRKDVLKVIASKIGLDFDFVDGEIVFSRYTTRTFTIEGSPRNYNNSDTIANASSSSGSGGSTTTTGTSSNSMVIESNIKAMADLEAQLNAIKSSYGKVVVSGSSNTVLIRDTRSVVDDAAIIIDKFNSAMSRQVYIDLDVISFTIDRTKAAGFDLGLAVTSYMGGGATGVISMTSPTSLVTSGGSLTLAANGGQMSGSTLVLSALNSYGTTHTAYKGGGFARNNMPYQITKQIERSYIDAVTATSSSTTTTSGITQAKVTYGFNARVYPTILSGNRVLLDGSISLSNLDNLATSSNGAYTVQSPEVSREALVSPVILNSGALVAFQVFERLVVQDKEQSSIFSFSRNSTEQIEKVIVVLRATTLGTD